MISDQWVHLINVYDEKSKGLTRLFQEYKVFLIKQVHYFEMVATTSKGTKLDGSMYTVLPFSGEKKKDQLQM